MMGTSDPLVRKIALNDLARAWGWKPARLYRLCARHRMPHVRIGGQIFFEAPALEAWLAERRRDVAGTFVEARVQTMTREAERLALGIAADHPFS